MQSFEEYMTEQNNVQEGVFNNLGNAAGNLAARGVNYAARGLGRLGDAAARGLGTSVQNVGRKINRMGNELNTPVQKLQYDIRNFQNVVNSMTDPKLKRFLGGEVLKKIHNYAATVLRASENN